DERADLAGEPIEELRTRGGLVLGHRELQDDVGVQVAIVGQVDLAHAPLADASQDAIPPLRDLQPDPLATVTGHDFAPRIATRSARVPRRGPGSWIAHDRRGDLVKEP